jgi:RimJ/RimL family protein N-acetyltransferase
MSTYPVGMRQPEAPDGPPLEGRFVRLRTLVPADYDYLYRLAGTSNVSHRWRNQGVTPNPASFADTLWRDVLAQFVAETRATGEPMGLVSCFAANHREGFAHIAAVTDPRFAHSGLVLTPITLLVNYVFTLWNFRKLYMEVPHFNYVNIESGAGRLFHEEGLLKGHLFYAGGYWDLHILVHYREDWDRVKESYLRLALPRAGAAPG